MNNHRLTLVIAVLLQGAVVMPVIPGTAIAGDSGAEANSEPANAVRAHVGSDANVFYVAAVDKGAPAKKPGDGNSWSTGGNSWSTDSSAESAELDQATSDLEAKLDAARAKLDEATHEVAELSAELGRPLMQRFMMPGDGPSRAVLGVQLDTAGGKEGARVREVSPGGPAADAGVKAGDVIVSVNGKDVKGDQPAREVLRLMRGVEPESEVRVRVLRDGKPRDLAIIARPNVYFRMPQDLPPLPPAPPFPIQPPALGAAIRGPLADMELTTLTTQLGRYFGTEKGVLVVRAPKKDVFKLEDGDVILAIDGREPTSGSHATRILLSYQPGEKISIKLMRQRRTINVETTLPDRPGPETKTLFILKHGEPS